MTVTLFHRPSFSRILRVVLLGIVLGTGPVGLHIDLRDGWVSFGPPMAMASGDDDDDDDDDSGRGRGRGRGGEDDDSSGSGGHDDDDDGSGSNSGPGNGGTGTGSQGSGGQTSPSAQTGSGGATSAQVWTVDWYRVTGRDIEVHYTDGWTEIIAGNRYLLIDQRNRVAINRSVRETDRARLAPLFQ